MCRTPNFAKCEVNLHYPSIENRKHHIIFAEFNCNLLMGAGNLQMCKLWTNVTVGNYHSRA